jgi:hypothetical protein
LIQRKTQDPDYWGSEFTVTPDDLQYLSTLLVEDELPYSADELGQALISHRCQQEEALIQGAMSKGTPYQPKRSYEIGEQVVFPALGYRVGEVVAVRPGHNPEHDSFQVIRVEFETGKAREFASEFTADHPLNDEAQASAELYTPDKLKTLYGSQVGEILEKQLESKPEFVRLAGRWFRRDLLVEVHAGHLNLAEAVLDMAGGGPLPTEDLLGDLELPEEITPQLRTFSLNYALQEDDRFDEVGPAGEVLWFLRRMEPEGVRSIPLHLEYEPLEYDPALLTSEMLALEQELDDERSNLDGPSDLSEPVTISDWPHAPHPLHPCGRRYRSRNAGLGGARRTLHLRPGRMVCSPRDTSWRLSGAIARGRTRDNHHPATRPSSQAGVDTGRTAGTRAACLRGAQAADRVPIRRADDRGR